MVGLITMNIYNQVFLKKIKNFIKKDKRIERKKSFKKGVSNAH